MLLCLRKTPKEPFFSYKKINFISGEEKDSKVKIGSLESSSTENKSIFDKTTVHNCK